MELDLRLNRWFHIYPVVNSFLIFFFPVDIFYNLTSALFALILLFSIKIFSLLN